MISRTLGTSSKKFASLRERHPDVGLFAQALYPLLVANADDFGRMDGDAFAIKHAVWSTAPETQAQFDAALDALHAEGLIVRYRDADGVYAEIVDFELHQVGLHKRTESRFPAYSGNTAEVPGNSGSREEKRTEEKRTEGNRRLSPVGRSDGPMAGALPRDHVNHAECSPDFSHCVPAAVHSKLRGLLAPKFAGDTAETDAALRAFYRRVWAALKPGAVMGDAFRFWTREFDEAFADKPEPRKTVSTGPWVPDAKASDALFKPPADFVPAKGSLVEAVKAARSAAK